MFRCLGRLEVTLIDGMGSSVSGFNRASLFGLVYRSSYGSVCKDRISQRDVSPAERRVYSRASKRWQGRLLGVPAI